MPPRCKGRRQENFLIEELMEGDGRETPGQGSRVMQSGRGGVQDSQGTGPSPGVDFTVREENGLGTEVGTTGAVTKGCI